MIIIDPKTRQRIITDAHAGDLQYARTGDSAIANEDKRLGEARQLTPGEQITREKQLWAGHRDELFGTDAFLEGARKDVLTERGNLRDTRITQQVQVRIKDIKKAKVKQNA